jgi:hypothetical protein
VDAAATQLLNSLSGLSFNTYFTPSSCLKLETNLTNNKAINATYTNKENAMPSTTRRGVAWRAVYMYCMILVLVS